MSHVAMTIRIHEFCRLGRGGRKGVRGMGGILSVLENNVKRLYVPQYESQELIEVRNGEGEGVEMVCGESNMVLSINSTCN